MHEPDYMERTIDSLPLLKKLALGASCCERLLPNYLAFSLMENWGDPQRLRAALDKVWMGLVNESHLVELHNISRSDLIQIIPDTENFTTLFTSLAGDAVASIVYAIESYLNPSESTEKILLVLQVAQNSIFQYLVAVNDAEISAHIEQPSFEEAVFNYPLMTAEIDNQTSDLNLIESSDLDSDVVQRLRVSSENSGIQPIKRGMVK